MGTQLLFTDLMVAIELLLNQLRGHRVAERERKRLKRTLNDIASLIPVTILMLLPVSTYFLIFLSISFVFITHQQSSCLCITINELAC
jgi:hypothetical protein